MSDDPLVQLALLFATMSLISVGGANATLPEIHRQVVDLHHWMSDATFAKMVAIGQTAPGPNFMVVSILGWQVAGWPGFLVASLAIVLPSCLIAFVASRIMTRYSTTKAVTTAKRGLAPIAVGLMLSSGLVMARAADAGLSTLLITAAMTFTVFATRLSPLWGIAGAGVAGVAVGHFGLL